MPQTQERNSKELLAVLISVIIAAAVTSVFSESCLIWLIVPTAVVVLIKVAAALARR